MPYPPTVPPTGRVNATPQVDQHPSDHNGISTALTDIINELGPNPAGSSANVHARLDAIEAKATVDGLYAGQSGQVYGAGEVSRMNWSTRSDNLWGTGDILTCPKSGYYVISVAVSGPVQPVGGFADVNLLVNGNSWASYIPQSKTHVATAMTDVLEAGQQLSVIVYNPVGSSQYYSGVLRILRYG